MIGADADISKALGQIMGLTPKVQNVPFDSILPGLAAGKYDLGISSFTDTKEREATVDFVTYAQAGTSFYSAADAQSRCRRRWMTSATTRSRSRRGPRSRRTPRPRPRSATVDVQVLPDQNGANLAISSGRAELGMADSPVAAYIVEQSDGKFKLGDAYGVAPYGIAIPKDSALAQPVLDAVKALYDDGTMQKIFDYWQLPDAAIDNPQINGAIS